MKPSGEFIIVFLFAVALICAIAFVCKLRPVSIFTFVGGRSGGKNKSGKFGKSNKSSKLNKSDPRVLNPSQPMSWELLL